MAIRLSEYLKDKYGEKVYRLSLSSGCTCPNRDGSITFLDGMPMTGGCTFCSEGGSGEFAASIAPIDIQIEEAKKKIHIKTDAKRFIAYFQSYTNTYGDIERLRKLYLEAIKREDIEILSLGTRPDCLGDEVMKMLEELQQIKPVWIELGLQTIHEKTAMNFHRGYDLATFETAYKRLKEIGISVIVHVIFGLPGETVEDMLETIEYLSKLEPSLDGIKLQNLQILKGTKMYEEYEETHFHILDLEEYSELIRQSLDILPDNIIVHRMTGDGPRKLLIELLWSLNKKNVLNTINNKTRECFLHL